MGDPGDSTDAEQLFAAFRKQEAEWRAKGLYQYLTDEEKAAREEEYRQIQAFQVIENDVENIEGGVEITKTCDKLVALATNEWHLRQVAEMSQKHTKNLWEKNGDLLNTYEDQYNQFLPALKSRWVSLEAALVERQKEAEEKRTLTEEETTLLALTLDEEYLKSAFLRLQGYAPTEEDEAACNVHAMDVFKKMKWEATFTLLRGNAMDELLVMHEDIDRARSQIRGRTRSPAELQEFVNTPAFQQKYTQQSMRQKIEEIARRPLDFVKPNRDPILPSQTAPLAKDPTPEECKILWHIVDCETLSTHAKHYSVARPSEDLMRQKRVKDMPPKAQEKWMREWEDNRDSLLSELNNLLASLKSKFADEGTFRGHKEELSRFNTHPLFKAQESALSKASEISAVTAALEKLINGDGTATPSPPRASPTTTPQSFGPAHYEKLSFLLSAEAALGHLTSMVNLNFKSVYAGKTMDEKVRLATLRVWSLTTSSTLKTLKAIQNDMDSRTKTLSAEEKNWLLLFRDDKDFLTYHNEQALTQQLCDTGKTVTEILEGNVVCNPLPAEGRAPATASNRGEDHKMLAKLLHAETVTALSKRVMQLMYGQVFSDSVASLGQQQKRDLYLKWTKCKSKVIKDLIQLRDATKENISEEERKRLTVYKDDPDFIAYNNGNETTQLLAGIENTIADLSEGTTFLPKDLPSAPEANQSVTEHTATEPSQMSRDAPPGPQDANLSTSSNQAEPTAREAPVSVILREHEPNSQSANKVDTTKDTILNERQTHQDEFDLLSALLNLEVLQVELDCLTDITFNDAVKGNSHYNTMVQSEKDKVTDLWRTKCSLIFDRVKVLHKNLQKRVLDKNPTDEERKRLMTLKDDPDFLLFHNGNLKTKEVQQLSGFVADVKFGRTIPNPDRDYELKCALMDVEEINKHVTLISAEDANAYMARDPNMKDETEENKLNWCCNWTTERNDFLTYLQALLPPLINKLKDMPADPEEKQRLTDMTEDATFLKYRDLHSLHPKIEFYVGLLQEVMQGNTGYMDRLFQSGLTEADYAGLFFFEEITCLQTFTNAYPNFHPEDLKKLIFTKTELVASMGPLKYYSLLVPLRNDAGFQEFKQTQHQHLHLSYFQYLLTNSPFELVPSEKYPNLKKFLECLVCFQVSLMLKEEVDKFSVLKLTEAVKAKHNFCQMEPDEQNNFITQWNTEYNYLTTRLQRHSAILDEQIRAFPIYQQVELFHDIAQNHEAFKNYLPQVNHHRSWLRLKDSIDNFTNTFDSFFSLKDQTYFSNVMYLKQANTSIAILEGNRQPSSYIMKAHKFDEMSPAQQESYLQAYKQSLVPYIQELKDIRNNLKTFIDENHMDADEFKRKLPKLKKNKGDEHDVHPTMIRLKQISVDALHLSSNWKYSPFDEKDMLILSHYFNYLECKDVLQLLKPQTVIAETLTTFGNQTFDADEKIWLTNMAKEHVKDVRNNIRKMKCHFKAKYEIVSLGMGSRCVRGEKDWKPLIKAFMQDPVCRQFHKENELTVNLLAERSRSYKHFTKYNYDIVTGSEQFLQIKRILDTSPNINIKELEVLKNSLKGRHETYNTKVQQLSPLLTSPHFYKYYLEDATTKKICELSSGAKDSFLRRVVTTFVEDSTYEAYLHMITSYMLANAHKRYEI